MDFNFETQKISEGKWKNGSSWEFHLSENMPDIKLISAVFSVPIYEKNNIALTKTHRGWELPGGHIDKGEKIENALIRETREEIGVDLIDFEFFGFRKIICEKLMPNREGGHYPMVGYIPYYLGRIENEPKKIPDGEEVLGAKLFSFKDLVDKKFGGKDVIDFLINEEII